MPDGGGEMEFINSPVKEGEEYPPGTPDIYEDGDKEVEEEDGPPAPYVDGRLRQPSHLGQGSWIDAAWHMGTAIPTPAAVFPLSFAISRLGWVPGIVGLTIGGVVTYYTSTLLASLNKFDGRRHARYRDLAFHILGVRGAYTVLVIQLLVNFGSLILAAIPAGQGLQYMYQLYHPGEGPTLQEWIIIFGVTQIILSIVPDLHSLRGVNLVSTCCVIIMSVFAFALTIRAGNKADRSEVDYGINHSTTSNQVFSIFNALAAIQLSYGNTMLVEIQATIREPCIKNMYKTISLAYIIIVAAYFGVGITGYWAFGYGVQGYLLFSLREPRWAVMVANIAAVIQCVANFQFYCQIIFEYFETRYGDVTKSPYAFRNLSNRLFIRTTVIVFVVFVSCLLPFLGDFVALVGAAGFTPADFIIPVIMWMKVNQVTGVMFYLHSLLIAVYTCVGIVGVIGAVRFIIIDAINFEVFANLCVLC